MAGSSFQISFTKNFWVIVDAHKSSKQIIIEELSNYWYIIIHSLSTILRKRTSWGQKTYTANKSHKITTLWIICHQCNFLAAKKLNNFHSHLTNIKLPLLLLFIQAKLSMMIELKARGNINPSQKVKCWKSKHLL